MKGSDNAGMKRFSVSLSLRPGHYLTADVLYAVLKSMSAEEHASLRPGVTMGYENPNQVISRRTRRTNTLRSLLASIQDGDADVILN